MTERRRPRSIRSKTRPAIGKKPRKAPESSEHAEQAKVITWARLNVLTWPELKWLFAIPNGARLSGRTIDGRRISTEAIRLKQEGLTPGVSDLFLPASRAGFHGFFVEMKYKDNGLTPEQARFLVAMSLAGFANAVCYSGEAAIEQIKNYLALEPKSVLQSKQQQAEHAS